MYDNNTKYAILTFTGNGNTIKANTIIASHNTVYSDQCGLIFVKNTKVEIATSIVITNNDVGMGTVLYVSGKENMTTLSNNGILVVNGNTSNTGSVSIWIPCKLGSSRYSNLHK